MSQPQVQLSLSGAEASLLVEVLDAVREDTRYELARTDDRRYRADVRARLDTLETLQHQLERLVPALDAS